MLGPWVVLLAALVAAAEVDGDETDTDEGATEEQSVAEAADAAGPARAGDAQPAAGAEMPAAAVRLAVAPAGRRLSQSAPVLVSRIELPDGGAVERLVETSGEVVVHVVNRVGTVLSCRTAGRLQALQILEQHDAAGGEVVQIVRDDSGVLLRYVVDAEGEPRAVALSPSLSP